MASQAVIFDMDGVLVDSEVHWRQVVHDFLAGLVPGWSESDQQSILGMSLYDVHRLLVEQYGVTKTREEYVDYYRDMARLIYGERASLLPGVRDAIVSIFQAGIPLGLASSSPHDWIGITLDRFALRRYFHAVVSAEDIAGKGKPAPDIYLFAARKLGVSPAQCVAVEDSGKGIASAQGAGMRCVGIRNGFNSAQDLSRADLLVDDLSQLTAAIESLTRG